MILERSSDDYLPGFSQWIMISDSRNPAHFVSCEFGFPKRILSSFRSVAVIREERTYGEFDPPPIQAIVGA
jgi:hypothetical protein